MAELLVTTGMLVPGSMGGYLREALPDQYFIVVDPVVHGCPMDAVTVGPAGFVLLQVQKADTPSGRDRAVRKNAARWIRAMKAFLHDEFPGLRAEIRHVSGARRDDGDQTFWEAVTAEGASPQRLEDAIGAVPQGPPDSPLASGELRERVALAVRDRQLTASMRAKTPFVFRSGGWRGSGTRVWTLRAAVRHMDRHPEDGVFHLRDGTLAAWLDDEGATYLADLARQVTRESRTDPRTWLETFVMGTGLAGRPQLRVRPRRLDFGYVLAGQRAERKLRIGPGKGRGYLFGSVEPGVPWLQVDPRAWAGVPLETTVSANTDGLSIRPSPQQAELKVDSSASAEPVSIPVRLRVVGMPARWHRFLVRPLAAAAAAALLGAGAGWLTARSGLTAPAWLAVPGDPGLIVFWTASAALLWGLCGLIRGLFQPLAWPVGYAALRWLARTAGWALALCLATLAGLIYSRQAVQPGQAPLLQLLAQPALPLALCFSILPASLHDIGSSRTIWRTGTEPARKRGLRWMAGVAVAVLVVTTVALLLLPQAGRAWQGLQERGAMTRAQDWVQGSWARLDEAVAGLRERIYLNYYDRRAPAEPAAAGTPAATGTPAAAGQTPEAAGPTPGAAATRP